MNPIDVLGQNPTGAIKSPTDLRDHKYAEVGFGSVPFDWSTVWSAEQECGFALPTKNQGGSGSCGGQAESYYGEVLSAIQHKTFDEKSAKFTYSPVAVVPGGGSFGRDLASRAINSGWGAESLTPSYENGQPPSEAFMERKQDITPEAIAFAHRHEALSYAFVNTDIDSLAQAARDNHGVRIGLVGSNNGTWLTANPQPPKDGETFWYHWLYVTKAGMYNGKKALQVHNSWGASVGDNGKQWLTEDYFTQHLTTNRFGTSTIFEATTYVFNPQTLPHVFSHEFTMTLNYGMSGQEVKNLQIALQCDGQFPMSVPTTGYYGDITARAVLAFQIKHQVASMQELNQLKGRTVGPATRKALNILYNN